MNSDTVIGDPVLLIVNLLNSATKITRLASYSKSRRNLVITICIKSQNIIFVIY
jgi:hypothetical protein